MVQSDVMNLLASFMNMYSSSVQTKEQKSMRYAINKISREIKKMQRINRRNQITIATFSIIGSVGLPLFIWKYGNNN